MLWFNFILGLNFISICFKLIIIHYQSPKQRELKFKPRIKYDPQRIYATNYEMWDIFPHQSYKAIIERVSKWQRIKVTLHHFFLQKWEDVH